MSQVNKENFIDLTIEMISICAEIAKENDPTQLKKALKKWMHENYPAEILQPAHALVWIELDANRSNAPEDDALALWIKHPVSEPPFFGSMSDDNFYDSDLKYFTHYALLRNEHFPKP